MLLKRLKKVFYLFDRINLYYKSIFRFKYPIFSVLCMFLILIPIYLIPSKYIFTYVIMVLIGILVSQSQVFQTYCEPTIDKYIFSYKHPYDKTSKIIMTTNEIEDKELTNPHYLVEKEEFNVYNDIIDPLKKFGEYKTKYYSFILKITKYIGTVEKVKNLFLWTDPKLSIYFLFLLVLICLIIFKIDFKYIFLFSMTKKFVIGVFYYKQKYINNIEVGRILLESCAVKWREQMEGKDQKDKTRNFQRLDFNIDLATIRVFDDKFKSFIAEIFTQNSNAVLSETLFNIITSLKDIQNELAKCEEVIKIKKNSELYQYVKGNNKILLKEVEPEDVFYYFVQNVKSDFYILRNIEKEQISRKSSCNKKYYSISYETMSPERKEKYPERHSADFGEENDMMQFLGTYD